MFKATLVGLAIMFGVMAEARSGIDIQSQGKFVYWEALEIKYENKPVGCAMATKLVRSEVYINFDFDSRVFNLVLAKEGWKVPPGTQTVVLGYYSNDPDPWRLKAQAHHSIETNLEINLGTVNIEYFFHEFTTKRLLAFVFEGSEENWVLNLDGSSRAYEMFTRCIRSNMHNLHSQPFATPDKNTQPVPTQPNVERSF